MAKYISSENILDDILAVEGMEYLPRIQHEVSEAKAGIRTIIGGADMTGKYYIVEGGEVRYSCGEGRNPELAQEIGFGIAM